MKSIKIKNKALFRLVVQLSLIACIILLSGCLPVPANKIDKIEFWQGDMYLLSDSMIQRTALTQTILSYIGVDSMTVQGRKFKTKKFKPTIIWQ